MESFAWLIILASLLFSAFFSGMEIAFISANKLKIELESKQGLLPARIFSRFMKNPSHFIATLLVGNNLALVIYGIVMAGLLEPLLLHYTQQSEALLLFFQTSISTLLVLLTAEFLPKVLFRLNPNKILSFLWFPAMVLYYILYPLVIIFTGISSFIITYIFKQDISRKEVVFGRHDIDQYLEESAEHTAEKIPVDHKVAFFRNALDFSNLKVRECMVPRTDIEAIEAEESLDVLKSKFIESGYSKLLVYRDSIDNIIGYIHSYELFKNPSSLKSILLPLLIVPESMPASEALSLFIAQRRSMALVVDEFGGTSGVLTIEDVMEQIFGEIEDEHDTEELIEQRINENEFLFSARHEVKYLNEKYNLKLPESEEFETLAGLVIFYHESIPQTNTRIFIPGFECLIKKVSGNRIDLIRLRRSGR